MNDYNQIEIVAWNQIITRKKEKKKTLAWIIPARVELS